MIFEKIFPSDYIISYVFAPAASYWTAERYDYMKFLLGVRFTNRASKHVFS